MNIIYYDWLTIYLIYINNLSLKKIDYICLTLFIKFNYSRVHIKPLQTIIYESVSANLLANLSKKYTKKNL